MVKIFDLFRFIYTVCLGSKYYIIAMKYYCLHEAYLKTKR